MIRPHRPTSPKEATEPTANVPAVAPLVLAPRRTSSKITSIAPPLFLRTKPAALTSISALMVNLVADNAKLVERAARIVSDIAGCSIEQAKPALAKSAGAVKPAVLIAQGADVAQATEMLRQSAGHLAPLLK